MHSPLPTDQLKAVLFDLDGTLLDTDDRAVDQLASRLQPFLGRHASPVARKLLMIAETPGNSLITILDRLGLDESLMKLTDGLRQRRGLYPARQFQFITGVEELLSNLRDAGYSLGIVTTRSRFHIDAFLSQYPHIAGIIGTTCGLGDTRWLKPHPGPILRAANQLSVPTANCLMVGDTVVDVKAARRAGAWSAAVLCGFGERSELERAGAHLILESTSDLGQALGVL